MLKPLKNKKGAALSFVIMILAVVSIMVGIVAMIASANIKQASAQERGLQAYYIARSGAELAYEVLMTTTPSYIDEFKNGTRSTISKDSVDFDEGTADVAVTSSGTGDTQKILITSVGTLKEGNITRTVKLEFYSHFEEHPEMVWSR